ncbi:3-oxoacyl-[acyl-carrier protein] reductase [Saccharopolyspora antimicrobica]|uniref:3-oxoacyl-[acyl-carrier protein] reductase n=1 Tax=Saccharopolyspora antimicrobica TaxID=455193 RepID=A0A1I5BKY1_9PSEU|nr:SDR family oxidoreductase [Saccharopolyspora antimicrobica]RKT86641.1 3-oxoacyl-[acyl-carrier protein] reductase [Saccharopolyspora antimicrobica]SFN75302.1 3-oxoacyl-[acyl-carrier protein] reductase [Saccharopolyspora antimicrobica]
MALHGKTAVVTGGSRGIGRAIVQRLTAEGATVLFGHVRDEAAAAALSADTGARAELVDVGETDQVARLFAAADEHLGELDILVNNAGIPGTTPFLDISEAEYDRIMAVNAKGTFLAMQHAARRMRGGGRIVNISSMSTAWASPGESAYAASKAAVEQLTQVAAKELGPRGITVNAVSPGPTDTDLLRGAVGADAIAATEHMTPLGRLGRPTDIADVVAFLVGPDAHWVTGQNIRATGGLV